MATWSFVIFQHSNFRICGGYVISYISLFLNGEIVVSSRYM